LAQSARWSEIFFATKFTQGFGGRPFQNDGFTIKMNKCAAGSKAKAFWIDQKIGESAVIDRLEKPGVVPFDEWECTVNVGNCGRLRRNRNADRSPTRNQTYEQSDTSQ
jgi:hypothetical protein